MTTKFNTTCLTILFLCFFMLVPAAAEKQGEACTSAIISGEASADGSPMLWKNRDTGFLSNKVVFVDEKPFCYVGIVNAHEPSGRFVYAGLNSEGFGVINTVAYNLPKKTGEVFNLEGLIMAETLRTCRTVDDFVRYLEKNMGSGLGSQANFGVMDSTGNAVIFELHNHGFKKYDSIDAPEKYLINTNYSRSGKPGKGKGYLRFERATALFETLNEKKVTCEFIFQTAARDWGHPLLKHPTPEDLAKISLDEPFWVYSRDCINRPSTASVVVLTGKKPGSKSSAATMWVLLGEPVTSIAVPVWVESRTTPEVLHKGDESEFCAEALRIKKIIRPYSEGSKKYYLNLSRLINKENTGFLPLLLKTEKEIFTATAHFLKKKHTPEEYADFQNNMAKKALDVLRQIKEKK